MPTKIVTIDSANFKVWEKGILKSTHPTHTAHEIEFTKYNDHWFTFQDNIDAIREYDENFNHLRSFDMTFVGSSGRGIFTADGALIYQYSSHPYVTVNGYLGPGPYRRLTGSLDQDIVTADGTDVYGTNASGGTVVKKRFTHTSSTITITDVSVINIAAGTVSGLSVDENELFVLYSTRLIKVYNTTTGAFIRNEATLGTSGTFNDIFVEIIPPRVIQALPYGLRFVTTAPAIDKFGDTQFGNFLTTYDSNGDNETGITKYRGRWYTCDNADDSIRLYRDLSLIHI